MKMKLQCHLLFGNLSFDACLWPGLQCGSLHMVSLLISIGEKMISVNSLAILLSHKCLCRSRQDIGRDMQHLKFEHHVVQNVCKSAYYHIRALKLWQSIDALMGLGHPHASSVCSADEYCTVSLTRRSPVFAGRLLMHWRLLSHRRRLIARFLVSSRWTSTM